MKKHTLQRWLGIGCLMAFCASAHALPSPSINSAGMGGACVAYPTDSLAQVYNPAATANLYNRLDLGATAHYWERDFVQNTKPYSVKREYAIWPNFGLNWWLTNNCAVGLTTSTWEFTKTDNQSSIPGIGTSPTRWDFWTGTIRGSIAWQFNCSHTLGLSADFYESRLLVRGLTALATAASLPPTNLTDMGSDYSTGVGVTIGYLWRGEDGVAFGASYSPRVRMRRFDRYAELLPNDRIDIPSVYRLGFALQPWTLPEFSWATDVEYRQYERIKSLHNSFNDVQLLGQADGPGWNWRNQWVARTGLEFSDGCLSARIGYRFESALFNSATTANYLNAVMLRVVQHYATAGLSWNINGCDELSAFGEYGFHKSTDGLVPAGIQGIVPDSTTVFGEKNFSFGLSYAHRF